MDRKTARAQAMKLIYEWEMGGEGGDATFENLLEITPGEKEFDFMNALVEGVKANVEAIDGELSAFVRGWSLDRLTRVDLAILRIATWELTQAETSERVVINEAVELANQYSTDKAGGFINGVLGNLGRSLDEDAAPGEA